MSEISKQCAVWELTIRRIQRDGTEWAPEFIGQTLKKLFKFFVFQPEIGEETGYRHYQFRGSLHKKSYKNPLLKLLCEAFKCELGDAPNVKPTAEVNTKNFNYVMKDQTREAGGKIWTDKEFYQIELLAPAYVPTQYRGKMEQLRPFQKHIFENTKSDDRLINVIYDPRGKKGKTTTAMLALLFYGGFVAPPFNDSKELIQTVCNYAIDNDRRTVSPIFIDMPRAMKQGELYGLYQGIETIKSGYLYDARHHFKYHLIESPHIWVFCNTIPDLSYLSPDRWKFWSINEDYELIDYEIPAEEPDFIDDDDEIISPHAEEKRLAEKLRALRKSIKDKEIKKIEELKKKLKKTP